MNIIIMLIILTMITTIIRLMIATMISDVLLLGVTQASLMSASDK